MEETIPILILREDTNQPHADILYVSSNLNVDFGSRDGIVDYCRKVVEQWKMNYAIHGVKVCCDPKTSFQWQDFVNVPADFLAKYGLRLYQVNPESIFCISTTGSL